MKWYVKLILGLALLAFIAGIFGMIYVVHAKFVINDYNTQISLAFNAAMLVNAQETYTDEAQAVIAETENGRFVIAPENYRSLSYFLKTSASVPVFKKVGSDVPLKISICGESTVYIKPDADGQGAYLRYSANGESFTMHVGCTDFWSDLIRVCEVGTYLTDNIPLT